jgi:anti-anti-sigma regulatory factor
MRIERVVAGPGSDFSLIGRLEGLASRHLLRMLSGPTSDGDVITVDASALEACDERGAAALVFLTKRARAAGGQLCVTTPRARVLHELQEAGALDDLELR